MLVLHALAAVDRAGRAAAARRARAVGAGRHHDRRTSTRSALLLAAFVRRADGADPVGPVGRRSCSASRCWPTCARTSSTACCALPLSTVERAGTGDLLTRSTSDVDALARTVRFAVPETLVAAVTTVLTLVARSSSSPLLALPLRWSRVPILVLSHPLVPAPRARGLPGRARGATRS